MATENGFLVITRKKSQSLIVEVGGQIIEVAVSNIDADAVAVAIKAPRSIRIHRKESWEKNQNQILKAHGNV